MGDQSIAGKIFFLEAGILPAKKKEYQAALLARGGKVAFFFNKEARLVRWISLKSLVCC
jgi:hypothetical protein